MHGSVRRKGFASCCTEKFSLVVDHHTVPEQCYECRFDYRFSVELWCFENEIEGIPFPFRHGWIYHRRIHSIDSTCAAIRIGCIIITRKNLYLILPHEDDAAIAALLPNSVRIVNWRNHPFDMKLNVSEAFLCWSNLLPFPDGRQQFSSGVHWQRRLGRRRSTAKGLFHRIALSRRKVRKVLESAVLE